MTRSAQEIQDWLVTHVSSAIGVSPQEIDVDEPLLRYGLDSVTVVALAADLESWLGRRFHENPLDEHPTIASLASFLGEQESRGTSHE